MTTHNDIPDCHRFYHNRDQEAEQNESKSHLVWLKQQRNIRKRQSWHSPEDGCRRLKGLKPYESRPLLLYKWNEPPNSINSSCSAASPPPHALSLSHTVKPVSFPVPHSSSCTVIEPRTELLSLAGYHRDPSLRTTAPLWGRRLAKSLHAVKRGERKWAEGEQVKGANEGKKRLQAALCSIRWVLTYICLKQQAVVRLTFI